MINGASRILYEVFGPEVGGHSRVAWLPFDVPVEIEAELELVAE